MLPDNGTEVVIGFNNRTLMPYVLGALYNGGDDPPDPYANEDGNDNLRVFWSRGSHRVTFDDTPGAERVEVVATTEGNAVSKEAHAANKTLTVKVEKDFQLEAKEKLSIKCKELSIEATGTITMGAGRTAVLASTQSTTVRATTSITGTAGNVSVITGPVGTADAPPAFPAHKHPPARE
jgi:uncharacterized protein involved in type VI secretion and phage assembly